MMETIRLLLAEGRRDLAFLGVVGEETDSLGARTVAGSTFVQGVQRLRPEVGEVDVLFERGPEVFPRLEGFPAAPVPFGSDAPTLRNLARSRFVVMTGPGSIRVAHTDGEFLDLAEAVGGARQYLDLARYLLDRPQGSD